MAVTILAIESSCDDTSAAVVRDGHILSNLIAGQDIHMSYGGVVPELASRAHQANIVPVVDQALRRAGTDVEEIDAVAFTRGPGLLGSLLVGTSFAKGFALAGDIPLIDVNHLQAHALVHFIPEKDGMTRLPEFPFLCLIVSGGHTRLIVMKNHLDMETIGNTIDDAAGEAFDKCGKLMDLPYPAGPLIDKLASRGNSKAFSFAKPKVKDLDFSFSGLKTAMLYLVRQRGQKWAQENLADLCAAYQEAIVDVLKINTFTAVKNLHANKLVLAGGVAANSRLRQVFQEQADYYQIELIIPSLKYCTDNAAMIARTGQEMLSRNQISPFSISAVPNLTLTTK